MDLQLRLLLQLQLIVVCVSAATIEGGTQIPSDGSVSDTFVAWISGDDACSQRTVFGGTSPCGSTLTLNGAQYLFVGCNGGSPAQVHDGNGNTLGSCSTRVDTEKIDCSDSPYPVYWSYECVVGGAAASTTPAATAPRSSAQISSPNTEPETSTAMTTEHPQTSTASSQISTLSGSNTPETTSSSTVTAISSQPTTLSTSTRAGTIPSNTATGTANPSNTSSSGMTLEARITLGCSIGFGVPMFILGLLMFKKPRQLARRFLRHFGCIRGP